MYAFFSHSSDAIAQPDSPQIKLNIKRFKNVMGVVIIRALLGKDFIFHRLDR